jgi:hypothetical protein
MILKFIEKDIESLMRQQDYQQIRFLEFNKRYYDDVKETGAELLKSTHLKELVEKCACEICLGKDFVKTKESADDGDDE